jgi:general secretion pathway protein G
MTLIEILVVLVIMGAIASAVGFSVMKSLERSRVQDTKTRARTIQSGAVAYQMDHPGECPEIADLLGADILDKTTDHDDGWGRPFAIDCEGTTVHVWSRGSDGQQGTEDDVGF